MKAIYIRTSTDEQNPLNQIKDCESMAGGEYILFQEQQSAWNQNKSRDEFERLHKQIRKGKITELYVWDLDRIYRNRKKLLSFFEFCKHFNCSIWSFRQSFLNDIQELKLPDGFEFIKDMMVNNFLNFLGWVAEDESKKKGERVRAAMRKRTDGVYSYTGKKWGRKQLSTQKKNKINKMRSEGKSIRTIAKELCVSVGVVHKYLNV